MKSVTTPPVFRVAPALACAAFIVLTLPPVAFGQQAAPSSPAASPRAEDVNSDEVVELSPFVVTAERGWSANSTLSATRTRQALKDVPVNIDSITTDFMDDLGLFTADEATKFVANVYAAPNIENPTGTDNFSFRGLSQRFNVSRNYFRWYIPSDTYNVERIDFGKGSNSLIFGDVEPGGQGAVFTKRAMMSDFATLFLQYGTRHAYRAQVDVNQQISDKLALRFNMVRRVEKTFQDFSEFGFKGEHLALTYRPFKNTEIRLEAEQGRVVNTLGLPSTNVREQSARSRAFTSAGWWITSDDTNNVFSQASLPAADRASANGPAGGTISMIAGTAIDITMRNASGAIVGAKTIDSYPRNYNIRGWVQRDRPFDTWSATIEQRVGDLSMELTYNHQNQAGLRNDNAFSQNVSYDVNGRPYTDSTGITYKSFGNDVDAFRFTAAYPWEMTSWMKQLVVFSADYREDFTNNYRYQLFNIAGKTPKTISRTADRVRLRAYLDDPQFPTAAFWDQFLLENIPSTATFQPALLGLQPATANAGDATEWRQQSSAALSASGHYFGGRLQSIIGVRRDKNKTLDFVGTRLTPTGEDLPPAKPSDSPEGDYQRNPNLDLTNTSYTAGLTYRLTPDINAYAVYSNSFRFQDARTFDRVPFGPITGVTREIGLKGDFWDGRGSLQLGVFHIDRENVEFRWTASGFTVDDVEDLINPNNITPDSPSYFVPWQDVNQFRNVLSTESSRGFDFTVMLRPVSGLQLRFTLAKATVLTRPDFSSFRAYYDAAVARGDESPSLMADAKALLDNNDLDDKPTGARAAPWSASWIVDYSFPRGDWKALHGVRVGINGNWRDNYLLAFVGDRAILGGQQHAVNVYIMRDQELWGRQVRVRAAVRNAVDLENDLVRPTGITTLANGTTVYQVDYVQPPQFDLSMTVRF
jgi:outer membrane receptor protein involved in Fe transport